MRSGHHCLAILVLMLGLASGLAAQIGDTNGPLGSATVQFLTVSGRDGATVPIEAGSVAILRRRLTVAFDALPLADVLQEISRQAGVSFAYAAADVPVTNRITLQASGITVAGLLTEVLIGTGLDVVVSTGNQLALVRRTGRPGSPAAANGWIVGLVTDSASDVPIENAEVYIDSLQLRTLTTSLGHYSLRVPVGRHRIGVRRFGYKPAQQVVTVVDSATVDLNFMLTAVPTGLQDIVITATGPKRRYELGNAIARIDAESILATRNITSVAELLETRVPGLTVQHTSGAPGDPVVLRLRGSSSLTRSNDPIVIVDGVRIYAEQSGARGRNLSLFSNAPAPSPLDQIDPQSIATIEVFKGPSAATMYGADAANGVIVITTKRGREGPPRWTVSTHAGTTNQPGRYPTAYLRWGHFPTSNIAIRCPLSDVTCDADSLSSYQLLNNPDLTVLGRGYAENASVGVSGGSQRLSYALNVSGNREGGLLKMPNHEVRRWQALKGESPPDWMVHPDQLTGWFGSARVSIALSNTADLSFNTALNSSRQARSSLNEQLGGLSGTYPDTARGLYYGDCGGGGSFSIDPRGTEVCELQSRITARATSLTNGMQLLWRPRPWLTSATEVGLNFISRRDETLRSATPGNDPFNPYIFASNPGYLSQGTGTSTVTTINTTATMVARLSSAFHLRTAIGGNLTRIRAQDEILSAYDIGGGAGFTGAGHVNPPILRRDEVTTMGWFIEPTLEHQRFYLSTGLRLDGADTYGSGKSLAAFPKASLSYLLSDEPFFPLKKVFSTLRLRTAYGQAGMQPGSADRLRLFSSSPGWWDGQDVQNTQLGALGNTNVRPERSREIEGGLDADLFGQALTLEFTAYRKTRLDALVPVTLPPSVNGGGVVMANVGRVRNGGFEISLGTHLFRSDAVSLSTQLHVSRNRNTVLSVGSAGPLTTLSGGRVVEGYPLFGHWARPILHFADVNGDHIITRNEVQLGDSAVFLGGIEPNYDAALHIDLSLARGMFTVSGTFAYQDGMLQINDVARQNAFFSRAQSVASAPLSEQAAAVVMNETDYGLAQIISIFRFNTLALTFNAPSRWAAVLGATSATLTLQGDNLGLATNYRGRDPSVNAYTSGNAVADTGLLPQPRTWTIGFRLGF